MKGLMLTFAPHTWEPTIRELTGEPPLDDVKAAMGDGWLELVPGFVSITVRGRRMSCVAFCDEDGKRKQMPTNGPATILWDHSLREHGHPGLKDHAAHWIDWLVGPVVVLAGDGEFMRSLREDGDDVG